MAAAFILKFDSNVNLIFGSIIVYRFNTTLYNLRLNIESAEDYLLENGCVSSVKNR